MTAPVAFGWDDVHRPPTIHATRVVLDCRHRVIVGARHRLMLYADGSYAPVFCGICERKRNVEVVVWQARR